MTRVERHKWILEFWIQFHITSAELWKFVYPHLFHMFRTHHSCWHPSWFCSTCCGNILYRSSPNLFAMNWSLPLFTWRNSVNTCPIGLRHPPWHNLSHCAREFHLSCVIHWKMSMYNPAVDAAAGIRGAKRWKKRNSTITTFWWNQERVSTAGKGSMSSEDSHTSPSSTILFFFKFFFLDHTRTIMAYWPSSVSMGTEKPFCYYWD